MSIIHVPDQHPGRCKNLRPGNDQHGYPTTKRCLNYEGTPHVCVFPPDPPMVGSHAYHGLPEPTPWVMPGDDGIDHRLHDVV